MEEKNRKRKDKIYNLDYESDFRIGLAVFYSFPSPASVNKWAGVSGIRKLFGQKALSRIVIEEQKRVNGIIQDFINGEGAVISFQKDAYEQIRFADSPKYSLLLAKTGGLYGKYGCDQRVLLAGAPPTRLSNTNDFQNALKNFKKCLI